MEWYLYLILALVLIVGLGVVVVGRMTSRAPKDVSRPSGQTAGRPSAQPGGATTVEVVDTAGEQDVDEDVEQDVDEESPLETAPAQAEAKPSFRTRMSKARSALTGALLGVRARGGITEETWDDLEEGLLRADVGIGITEALLGGLKQRVKDKEIVDPGALLDALQAEMEGRIAGADRTLRFDEAGDGPNVWLFVGVNGAGKTTTIGKVAAQQRAAGRRVLLAAGDTFRAAAAEQLHTWAERADADFVRGNEGGDPGAVIFDAIESARAKGIDLVLGDTAGRLHSKSNLMDELRKIRRVAAKGAGRVTEVLLVIDATTGQNGLAQAREFGRATTINAQEGDAGGVTGVVLTKLDGSAKGGIVFAIETELGLPVKLVGLGETIDDLVAFDPHEFIDALFATD